MLLPVVYLLELEAELQNTFVKAAFEPSIPLGAVVPLLVNDAKGNVFVRRPRHETNNTSVFFTCWGKRLTLLATTFSFNPVSRGLFLVNKIGGEDVELVTLTNLGWGVVMIVVRLVVFFPFVAHLYSVE